ncbi:hypothetical protein ABZ876_02630 [Streptomyces sp. NPDC046931]|uniref:hypothetical protein n=1 Tax=Streptomyces sp. NPDC046931 TaxID=3154806 RepID=UPI0033FB2438
MSLVDLIAQADERALAASGLACLDRCVPLLGGDDDILRPLWASLVEGHEWEERLAKARTGLDSGEEDASAECASEAEAARLARRMLEDVPAEPSADALRRWADACSVAALRIHQLLDPADDDGDSSVAAHREGLTDGMSPLVAAELRRQVTVLELVADHGATGLRQARDVSTEGRRVLQAVVSRRARGRS